MLELLEFVFASFWRFAGVIMLIWTAGTVATILFSSIVSAARGDDVKLRYGVADYTSTRKNTKGVERDG
jgi:hypothetical protein